MKSLVSVLIFLLIPISISLAQEEFSGFPITYTRAGGVEIADQDRGPVVGDVTGDGYPEIIVVGSSPGSTIRNQILVYDSSAALLFQLDLDPEEYPGYRFSQTPALADGDGDGVKEII
jgi:hypothetical protein